MKVFVFKATPIPVLSAAPRLGGPGCRNTPVPVLFRSPCLTGSTTVQPQRSPDGLRGLLLKYGANIIFANIYLQPFPPLNYLKYNELGISTLLLL